MVNIYLKIYKIIILKTEQSDLMGDFVYNENKSENLAYNKGKSCS